MNSANTANVPVVIFWRQWYALHHYVNAVYLYLLDAGWYDLVAAVKGYFQPTLEDP